MKISKFILTLAPITFGISASAIANGTAKTTQAAAAPAAMPSPHDWTDYFQGSQIGLGGSLNTGDNNSRALNSQIQIQYTRHRWKDFANFQANYGKSNRVINQEKYQIANQLWYYLNKKESNFISWGANDTIDKLNSYAYEATTNLSLGRELYRSNRMDWTIQAGPGMRRTKLQQVPKTVENDIIGHAQSSLAWTISPSTTLSETVTADIGKPFNKFVSQASLTNKLMAHLATSLSFETDYYSALPANTTRTKHLDTITQLNLVYSF